MNRNEIIELILAGIVFVMLLGISVWTINFLYTISTALNTILG